MLLHIHTSTISCGSEKGLEEIRGESCVEMLINNAYAIREFYTVLSNDRVPNNIGRADGQ